MKDDPRFTEAINHFNCGAFGEAGDLMEDLFFEAVGDERPVARVLLQLFVGFLHVEQNQLAPALERLEVGLEVARGVRDWMSLDGTALTHKLEQVVRQLREGEPASPIEVEWIGDLQ